MGSYEERIKKSEEITDKLISRLNKLSPYEKADIELYSKTKEYFLNILKNRNMDEFEKLVDRALEITNKDAIRLNKLSPYQKLALSKFIEIFFIHLRNLRIESKEPSNKNESNETKVIIESKKDKKYAIFITHSIKDRKLAGLLKGIFDELDVSSFVAHDDIEKGLDWKPEIIMALNNSTLLLVLGTKNIEESPWVNFEIGLGYGRILPIFIDKLSDRVGYIKDKQGIELHISELDKTILEIIQESFKKIGLENNSDLNYVQSSKACKEFKAHLERLVSVKKPSLTKALLDVL